MAKLPVIFKYGTRAEYDALEIKSNETLYFLTDTGEIYRGAVNLARGNYHEGIRINGETDNQVITRILGTTPVVKDDIFIIKTLIADNKYSHISFIYDGVKWAAMDGNYNAENVYFDEDIVITQAVGNIDLSGGSAIIPAAGKNIKQVFETLWTKENFAPIIINPSIKMSINKTSVEGEVGTIFDAPIVTAEIENFGSFQFGSKDIDGIFYDANAKSDIVFSILRAGKADRASDLTDVNSTFINNINVDSTIKSVSYLGNTGLFNDDIQIQKFSAYSTHGGSARKGVSNLGNLINNSGNEITTDFSNAINGIAANAGITIKDADAVFTATGYRAWFIGMLDTVPAIDEITGTYIRENLINKGKLVDEICEIKPGEAGAKCVLIAIPAKNTGLIDAILTSSMNINILEDYLKNKIVVKIADASGEKNTEIDYNVYLYQPALLGFDEIHSLTVKV